MKLERRNFFIVNIVLMISFMLIMATINLKINRMEIKLKFFILPIFLGVLFASTIAYLSIKRTRYLEDRIREKTKEFEYYATMDEMTNTYNRRMGLKMMKCHFLLSKRHKNILSVCYLDINRLKFINDNFGHDKGDELIKDTSKMLRSSVRESDIVARMGGDEFLIILPDCDVVGAKKVIKRLTEKMQTYNKVSRKCYRVSVSFGLSESSFSDKKTMEDMLVEADNRMYAMKKISKRFVVKNKNLNLYRLKKVAAFQNT